MISFLNKNKVFLIGSIIIISIFIITFMNRFNVSAEVQYKLIKDNNGINWQYGYDSTTKSLEVSFFDSDNSLSEITIPNKSFFISKDYSIGEVFTYTFTNYSNHNLGTPRAFSSTITKLDLSNVNVVGGIQPLSNNTTSVFQVILNPNGSKIGFDVFRDKKIDISNLNKVFSISGGAFYNTSFADTDIKLPNLVSLGAGSFEQSNITSLEINSGALGVSSFKNCKSLTSVKLLEDVTRLNDSAFEGDENLTSFTFNNVISVGNRVFKDCTKWNIDIGNTKIEFLGSEVFSGCTSFTKTTIPSKVTKLNYRAFYQSGMTDVNINNVYDIDTQAFDGANLSSIDLKNVERIWYGAFANNHLTELYLPKSIKYMWSASEFYNNPIKKITIAYDTLIYNNSLWVNLDSDLDSNNYQDVSKNTSNYLEEVVLIPPYKEGEEIDLSNHLGFDLKRYYLLGSNDAYGGKQVTDFKNVVGAMILYNLPKLKKVTIGEGFEFLGAQNFAHNNNSLEEVILPSTLKGIGFAAFQRNDYSYEVGGYFGKNNPIKINLPESLEYIGQGAFQKVNLTNTKIDLPNLKVLKDYAFQFSNISELILHDKLEKVGNNAFNMAPDLKKITFDCDYFKISDMKSAVNGLQFMAYEFLPFTSVYSGKEYISMGYDTKKPVQLNEIKFTEKAVTPPSSSYAMFFNNKIKTIDLENVPWTELDSGSFLNADIVTLKLPKKLSKIQYATFYNTKVVNPIELPNNITEIGVSAFMHSNIIAKNNLPNSLKKIGTAAFLDCKFNENIVVPESVETIERGAFQGYCSNSDATYPNLNRKSITFNNPVSAFLKGENNTVPNHFSTYLWYASTDEIIFGDKITELPTLNYNNANSINNSSPEFVGLNTQKVIFKNLVELPKKAFIDNEYIKEIDFSEDPNLTKIDAHAFYNTPNLKKIKLYHDLDLTIDEHAFHGSGLTSLNDEEGIDLKSDKITLNGDCIFQGMPNIKNLEISNKLNNGIIPEGTFSDEVNLEKSIIYDGVTNIKHGAFANDKNLKTFVMYGDTEIENEDGSQTIELKDINDVHFYSKKAINNNFTIKVNDTTNITNSSLVYDSSSNRYDYQYVGTGDITIRTSDNIIIQKDGFGNIIILDKDDYNTTIPSTANLYCYLKNEHCNTWNNTYKSYKQNENSDLYYLDEVLYLDSNKRFVTLNEEKTDINKDDLTIYALRRDGVILISDEWGKLTDTKKYVDSGITIKDYNSNTTNPKLMVFNTNVALNKIDTTTNDNFKNIDYEIGEEDPVTKRVLIDLVYPNKIVNTTAGTVLKTKGNYVDIVYSDGCGGESFANVIYEDILIGEKTPQFNGTPMREGYEFIGWDKKISENAEEDIVYTAKWKKIENNYSELVKDIPTDNIANNLVNPLTKNNIKIFILIISFIVFVFFVKKKFVFNK